MQYNNYPLVTIGNENALIYHIIIELKPTTIQSLSNVLF